MKRLPAVLFSIALCLAAGVCPIAARAAGPAYMNSGCKDMPKLSKKQMTDLLDSTPATAFYWGADLPEKCFDETPSVTAPHTPGVVKGSLLDQTLARLNMLRAFAGLPAAVLDPELCRQAQYGAVLLAAGEFSHFPARPADMAKEFYEAGLAATSTGNISAGRFLTSTPDGFMDDSSSGNVPMVGHRRWQLNPALGKVGFGFAYNPGSDYRCYTAEKVFDGSGTYGAYDFISWPPSGSFPVSGDPYWTANTPFSLTLNPQIYAPPRADQITVTLQRKTDGALWTFSGKETYSSAHTRYFNVNNEGYGVNNCIIFRPDGIDVYEGVYTVTVTGLSDNSGTPAAISYQIDFFDPEDYREHPPEPGEPGRPGDVDGDGFISSTDARLALQLSVEKIGEEDLTYPDAADPDGDGTVTSTDARLILQMAVGKITRFPQAGSEASEEGETASL